MTERNTWPFWKCLNEKSQGQFIQYIWDTLGIDLLKEDKPGARVTYSGKIESLEEIDRLIRKPPEHKVLG